LTRSKDGDKAGELANYILKLPIMGRIISFLFDLGVLFGGTSRPCFLRDHFLEVETAIWPASRLERGRALNEAAKAAGEPSKLKKAGEADVPPTKNPRQGPLPASSLRRQFPGRPQNDFGKSEASPLLRLPMERFGRLPSQGRAIFRF
jgi:hypothetical protein